MTVVFGIFLGYLVRVPSDEGDKIVHLWWYNEPQREFFGKGEDVRTV